jgi:hypothetical protein
VTDFKVVAKDGIEPPPPTFSGPRSTALKPIAKPPESVASRRGIVFRAEIDQLIFSKIAPTRIFE